MPPVDFTETEGVSFMMKVARNADGCHLWMGSKGPSGYGILTFRGNTARAHRIVWIASFGDVPAGACVLHRCDVRCCVNPEHLFVGSQLENIADRVSKGRSRGTKWRTGELNPMAKLKDAEIPRIIAMRERGATYKEIGERFGVSGTQACAVVRGRHKRAAELANA